MNLRSKILQNIFPLLTVSLLTISANVLGQNIFQVHFKLPININSNKLKFFYTGGKEWKKIKGPFNGNEVIISDSLFSKYATISCTYYTNDSQSSFSNSFFVWEAPSTISISENQDTLKNPFLDCKLINAYEIDKTEEAKRFKLFTANESIEYSALESQFGDKIYTDSSFIEMRKKKYHKLLSKEFEFIRQNGKQYYSLWLFKNDILPNEDFISPDSLLKAFNRIFIADLRNSFDGKQIEFILRAKTTIAGKNYALYFKSVDIHNKIIDLNNYKGKYVLISFWASWCKPCLAELGTLRKINDKYGKTKLVLVSVSIDREKKPFLAAIKKYKMDWINIYHDVSIENVYLQKGGIPQVYLVDQDGELKYSSEGDRGLHKIMEILSR